MSFSILGTGSSLPSRTISNEDLKQFLDTSDEWIASRTGIRQRRVCTVETVTDLAEQAARRALEDAGVAPEELDFILCSTVRGDYITPSLACALQQRLGASCPGFDLNGACAGFVYALDAADGYFLRGRKKVLVVAAEAMSRIVDWADRSTCVLFGDGAGAVVLGHGDGLGSVRLTVRGNAEVLRADHSTGNCPYTENRSEGSYLYMNGQEVYKFAVSAIEEDIRFLCAAEAISPEEVDWFLLHQANRRIIEAARSRLNLPAEKFPVNIDQYGNTSSASVAILLDELNRLGALRPGQTLLLSAFGAGLTTGSCVLRWTK